MKIKAISFFLVFCMTVLGLFGCQIVQINADQETAAQTTQTDEVPTIATDIQTQADQTETEQVTTEPTEAEQTTAEQIETTIETTEDKDTGQNPYLKFMENLNREISDMEELFYEEKDLDGDGNVEIIAAFGVMAKDEYGIDQIRASFALRDKNGKIELIKQDFCDGSGYECSGIRLAQFVGSDNTFVVVDVTNGMSMNGLAIYEVGNGVAELARAVSPVGVCYVYLTDEQRNGSYGGFAEALSGYDVFYYPVTTFYKYENRAFVRQGSSVEVGAYPKTPTDVIIQYLALNCLLQNYYSEQITERIYELADYYASWGLYGSLDSWYSALSQYLTGTRLQGEPGMTVDEYVFKGGEMFGVTIEMSNPQMTEDIWMDFHLVLGDGKLQIAFADWEISVGAGKENVHFSTTHYYETYYNDGGGQVLLDLWLPWLYLYKIEGSYDGIAKINEYFTQKRQYFYDDISGLVDSSDDYSESYYRSANYRFEAKIGDIISISGQTGGWLGGSTWDGVEGGVFDLATGKKLGLSDIFKVKKDQYLSYIYDFVEREVAKLIEGDPDSLYYSDDSIRTAYNEDNFYLTEDFLVVFYQKYDIAAGAAGSQIFYIPYYSISDMLAIAVPLG